MKKKPHSSLTRLRLDQSHHSTFQKITGLQGVGRGVWSGGEGGLVLHLKPPVAVLQTAFPGASTTERPGRRAYKAKKYSLELLGQRIHRKTCLAVCGIHLLRNN